MMAISPQPLTSGAQICSFAGGTELAGESPPVESRSPWSDQVVATLRPLDRAQLDSVIRQARAAEKPLAALGWASRGQLLRAGAVRLRERAKQVAELVAIEVGKPITEARIEVERSAAILDYYAGAALQPKGDLIPSTEPGVAVLTRRRPLGTVLAITPWNFPLAIPAWKIAPALLCGNPVIWKPATAASASARALIDCFHPDDAPAGTLSLVLGPASTVEPLLHARLRAMSFTGSTDVGHTLRDLLTPRGVRVQLELGGKNAAIVLDDAAPEAFEAIARAAYSFAGQKCTATSVVIATPGIYSEVTQQLAELTQKLPWGDPLDESAWGGPVIDTAKAAELNARLEGQQIIAQRSCPAHPAVVPPTLVGAEDRSQSIAREELFGPVLTILPASNADHAVALANDSEYGLVASVYSRDIDEIRGVCNQLETGLIAINRASTGLEVQAPSGGWKASGGGDPEQGAEAIRFYTESQTIYWKSRSAHGEFP